LISTFLAPFFYMLDISQQLPILNKEPSNYSSLKKIVNLPILNNFKWVIFIKH